MSMVQIQSFRALRAHVSEHVKLFVNSRLSLLQLSPQRWQMILSRSEIYQTFVATLLEAFLQGIMQSLNKIAQSMYSDW